MKGKEIVMFLIFYACCFWHLDAFRCLIIDMDAYH
jgi:hypothetical protein